jgi:dienelactone hydrolase
MLYSEKEKKGNKFRNEYLEGIEVLIEKRRKQADRQRATYFKGIEQNREKYRNDFLKMLGWPLVKNGKQAKAPECEITFVAKDDLATIYRLQMTVLGGLKAYAMLFIPNGNAPHPIAIVQHGGGGTPEVCAHFFSTGNYNNITRRILGKGVAVFSPQTLLWREKYAGNNYDRNHLDNELKQLGGSITALEVYCINRWIDYLFTRDDLDCEKLGMTGLSYGGFYTLFTAASDTRIKTVYSSCFFNNRYIYDWTDWTWQGSAQKFLDAEVGAIICPRPLYIEVGKSDELFYFEYAIDEFNRLKDFYSKAGAENLLEFKIFEGTHEYDKSDDGIDFLIKNILSI